MGSKTEVAVAGDAAVVPAKQNVKKSKSDKAPKEKKSVVAKKSRSHPPYLEMINEAISSLKERTGSSQYAIAKFIEEKQKEQLPPNFKKLLLVQLRKLVASGKLTKVKYSFKLGAPEKSGTTAVVKKALVEKKAVPKPKKAATTPVKAKKVVAKPKRVEKKPKKVAKPAKVATPGKKAVKKVSAKLKKTPVKAALKRVKSIKSPAKKAKK